jgi:hypothetical protein
MCILIDEEALEVEFKLVVSLSKEFSIKVTKIFFLWECGNIFTDCGI